MFRLNIEDKNGQVSLKYSDEDMWQHYHARRYTMGHTWQEYMDLFAPKRENPFFFCDELYGYLKGLCELYGEYIVVSYRFNGININPVVPHCTIEFGETHHGKTLKEMAEILKDLLEYHPSRRYVVDIFAMELISNTIKTKKSKRKRTHIPRGLRHEVFKRDNYTCVECGASKEDGATLHIDHIIPISKGGSDELDNLQTLCSDCNLNKSNLIQGDKT